MKKIWLVGGCIVMLSACWERKGYSFMPTMIKNIDEVVQLFPSNTQDLIKRKDVMLGLADKQLQAIIDIPDEQRTFDNTVRSFDLIGAKLGEYAATVQTLQMVSTDQEIRDVAMKILSELEVYNIEHITYNRALYKALCNYVQGNALKETLNSEEKFYLSEALKGFKKSGLDLPEPEQEAIKKIKKELTDLGIAFEANINADQSKVKVALNELAGLEVDYIAHLPREGELYVLGVDTPTYTQVMENCSVGNTRKMLWEAYSNRAYPKNSETLKKIIALRDELAHKLGYKSYAALSFDDLMVQSVGTVDNFLADLIQHVKPKVDIEMAELMAELPAGIELTSAGQFKPWDLGYVKAQYKKKHLQVNERLIAEYFPIQKTIQGLLHIYEQFLGVKLTELKQAGFWHPDVRALTVEMDGRLLGYLLLDLHPRPFKYSHACEIGIIKAHKTTAGNNPAVAVVIANFPKPTGDKPALLQRSDVRTFFHEFGHALHELFGATEMFGFAGTSVKLDFVEMPSQMLEEWLYDPAILKQLSVHYITGEPLPDTLIDRICALKKFDGGNFVQSQVLYSRMSLDYYKEGATKDPHAIKMQLMGELRPYVLAVPEDHFEANFGHLVGYGAGYYGYLWSKVFALDMFEHIKKAGLLNPEIGRQYIAKILAPGGSKQPMEMLEDFLGRAPKSDAFFEDLGV
jgi:thimet oligopeptidase